MKLKEIFDNKAIVPQLKSASNWGVVFYLVLLVLLIIGNNHRYETKVIELKRLNEEMKELRTEYVERRSELMRIKMESNVSDIMQEREVYPSQVPPQKIRVVIEKEKKWYELWD
ncbi:FtsL-like putative cell division protein [Capnocytophaga sp. ARDL2]|uniref:FtsL-like putative cell division protein n=1 Tax=Capnocytophaga sp. ARDL2 TaxID=3238809 RepID=UPI003558B500